MQVKDIAVESIMQIMTHDDLYLYKRKNSNAAFNKVVKYDQQTKHVKKGIVFVSSTKEDLTQGKGYIISSYETLEEKIGQLSHWTPNTYRGGTYYDFKNRIIKGHTRDNLKQINVIGFDIDTKDIDLYGLLVGCDQEKLPRPNLILSTPKGYQGFFILETPFYIHKNKDYKALRVAERLSKNILNVLSKHVPIDLNCSPFGFFRMPDEQNVVLFDDELVHTASLIEWSKTYEKQERKNNFHVIYGGKDSDVTHYTSSGWYRALIQAKNINKGHYASSRNNALLTLALANYADGVEFKEAYDVLDQFNSYLDSPLSKREFERTINSAYSGRYKGVQRDYVESLLENWTDGTTSFHGKEGWYKFAKPREDRERSHYWEWKEDILSFLNEYTTTAEPFFESTLRDFAQRINIPLSTLKIVLKKSDELVIKTIGKGRGAKTLFAKKTVVINHLIEEKNNSKKHAQMLLFELLKYDKKLNRTTPTLTQKEVKYHRDTS